MAYRQLHASFSGAVLLALLLTGSVLAIAGRHTVAVAQERPVGQGGGAAPAREKESGLARAARVVADRLAAAFPRVEGMIIGFDGEQVLIDRGTEHGVFQGMELEVFREGEEFKHPLTSEALGRMDKELGMIRVLQVQEQFAVATITKRPEKVEFRQGDQVRVSMARMIVAFPNCNVEEVKGASTRAVMILRGRERGPTLEILRQTSRTVYNSRTPPTPLTLALSPTYGRGLGGRPALHFPYLREPQ